MSPSRHPFLLVIEPSLTLRTLIDVTLRRQARVSTNTFPVSWALFADPVPALRAIYRERLPVPHLGLVCRDLPHLDGYAVMQHMQRRGYPTAFLVCLSAEQDSPLERMKAHLAGARATLAKPYTVQQLLAALALMHI